jgi:FlaA1/EpsC-like NDP-sugar epimerase
MLNQFRNPHIYLMLLVDVAIFVMSYTGACLLRFEFTLDYATRQELKMVLPFLITIKLFTFFCFGLYRGIYRYFSIQDLWRLGSASVLSSVFVIVLLIYIHGFRGFSRSVFLLDGFLTFLFTTGLRVGIRSFYYAVGIPKGFGDLFLSLFSGASGRKKNVLIIGAGGGAKKC